MNNTILSWNGTDHTAIYMKQLKENPLYYDPNLKIWVAYSYDYCKTLLLNADAHVPELVIDKTSPLNGRAKLLSGNLARLSNQQQHEAARGAAMRIWQKINEVDMNELLKALLCTANTQSFDWVETIGCRLPVQIILKGLNFNRTDSAFIISNLATLVRVMSPNKTEEDIKMINPVINRVYEITQKHMIASGFATGNKEETELLTCNLIGLFIQCYDAGRGLLSNTLLSLVANRGKMRQANDTNFYQKLVTETLRWNPPVHNTRRIAVKDIRLQGQTIRAGETILIVLAAANLDHNQFKDPEKFDISRDNNDQHLTFGIGGHNCLAKYMCINMAIQTCSFLMDNYQTISIIQKDLIYEPQLNVRLIKELIISLA